MGRDRPVGADLRQRGRRGGPLRGRAVWRKHIIPFPRGGYGQNKIPFFSLTLRNVML